MADRNTEPFVEALVESLGERVTARGSVGELSTYRVGGSAAAIVSVDSVDTLEIVRTHLPADVPALVVGAGSNLLVSDGGFDGVVLQLGETFASVDLVDGDAHTRVVLGGATMLPRAARQLTAHGLTGFEWAVGVPGTVGGAVRMNAGGHGSDMAASIRSVSIFNLRTGGPEMWPAERCDFAYRSSAIGSDDIVLYVELDLERAPDSHDGQAELSDIVSWRRQNQPGGPNAGSVFANPPGDSAGRLIDACGLKGFRVGSARISEKHANFIQADPEGSADDVAALISEVRRRVRTEHGVELRVENRLIGFDADEQEESETS